MTDAEYFALDAVSSSRLTDLARSPAYAKFRIDYREHDDTDATRVGDATHCAILTPELFEARFVRVPDDAPKRPTKAQREAKKPSPDTVAACQWWAEFERENAARAMLGADDFTLCLRLRDAVWAHPDAKRLLDACESFETPGVWADADTGLPCKIKPDARGAGLIVDLKTTRCASKHAFTRSVLAYGYHRQDALYTEGASIISGEPHDFWFIVAEKQAPVQVAVYALDDAGKALGMKQVRALRSRYAECVKTGIWPGLTGGLLTLPAWADSDTDSPEPADVSGTFEETVL